jgi:hypothetical protein
MLSQHVNGALLYLLALLYQQWLAQIILFVIAGIRFARITVRLARVTEPILPVDVFRVNAVPVFRESLVRAMCALLQNACLNGCVTNGVSACLVTREQGLVMIRRIVVHQKACLLL